MASAAFAESDDDSASYVLGAGVSADNGDGRSIALLGEFAFNSRASLFASFATTDADATPEDVTTRDWSVGGRYDFGPVGFEFSGGQSGDPDDFDSEDQMLGLFHNGEHWRLSARYLRRDIDLIVRPFLRRDAVAVSVPLEADGWRVAARYRSDSRFSWGASYRRYDYDRNLSPLSGQFIVLRLSPTTLTLASALIDDAASVDVEFPLGNGRALGFNYARDTLAGGLGDVDSVGANLLLPVGQRGDLDIGVGVSRGDGLVGDDSTAFLSLTYLFYDLLD